MSNWRETGNMSLRQMIDLPPLWLVGAIAVVRLQIMWMPVSAVHPWAVQALGAVLVIMGVSLMIWAVAAFRAHQTSVVPHQMPRHIITGGPFALSRNPIYLGDVLVLGGVILWWGAWPSLVLIPVFGYVLQRRFIAPEELRMKQNFGTVFEEYAQKTRRWI